MAMEFMREKKKISKIRVQYKKPAVLGDTVYPRVALDADCLQVELDSKDGAPYAVVELSFGA